MHFLKTCLTCTLFFKALKQKVQKVYKRFSNNVIKDSTKIKYTFEKKKL